MRAEAEQEARRDERLRPHRGPALQPHVRDTRRPGRGVGVEGLPPPRDGAGHLHQLQERRPTGAPQAAVRHRAGRQVVPQRDHAGQLHLPHARVRADGDGVLRPARRGRDLVPVLDRRAVRLVSTARHPRGEPARPPARGGRAVALLERDERHRVPVPDRLAGARGGRQPRRLSTSLPTPRRPARSSNGSTPGRASATRPT